ncbi:MAG: hypothetical protein CL416_02850 [Acidimicrobiaceae bacterium]|nr:hypothetical protein [Acidimicrobiaceae bacterium]|tara:strand:- start:64 stop:552 length:489 start_codon:yes stop_codon:yes gene_type:complete
MSVLFGSLTSLFIGLSDLFLVSITKRSHIVTVVVTAFVSAGLVALVGTVFIAGDLTGRDMALGAGSGVFMAFGLVFYFAGIQRSSVGIVAPLIALQIALWPLFYDVIDGARPSALVWVGVSVAIVSLLLTTISPDLGDWVWLGIRWACWLAPSTASARSLVD